MSGGVSIHSLSSYHSSQSCGYVAESVAAILFLLAPSHITSHDRVGSVWNKLNTCSLAACVLKLMIKTSPAKLSLSLFIHVMAL